MPGADSEHIYSQHSNTGLPSHTPPGKLYDIQEKGPSLRKSDSEKPEASKPFAGTAYTPRCYKLCSG